MALALALLHPALALTLMLLALLTSLNFRDSNDDFMVFRMQQLLTRVYL
jgi:hypothetical protein